MRRFFLISVTALFSSFIGRAFASSRQTKDDISASESNLFSKLDDLLRYTPSSKSIHSIVHVLGRSAPNDGGGGFFRWDNDSSLEPDEGTVFNTKGNSSKGRWLRVLETSAVNVRWFGARGDGFHDDTYSFMKLFEFLDKLTYCHLVIPSGTYVIKSNIYLANRKSKIDKLLIEGSNSKILIVDSSLFLGDLSNQKTIQINLSNITIESNDSKFNNSSVLNIGSIFSSTFLNVEILGGGTRKSAIEVSHPWGTSFTNCHFGYSQFGAIFSTSGNDSTHMGYYNCTFDHCSLAGAIFVHHISATIQSCSFEHNDGVGLSVVSGKASCSNVRISNCYLLFNCAGKNFSKKYAALNVGVKINGLPYTSSQQMHISILNNYITGTTQKYAIHLNVFAGLECSNNRLDGSIADILIEGTASYISPLTSNRNHTKGDISIINSSLKE
jgi:Pectate lyase superfamily protein